MPKWKVTTETIGVTITRTYIVESDEKPDDVSALDGALLLESDSDDYDDEQITDVEPD